MPRKQNLYISTPFFLPFLPLCPAHLPPSRIYPSPSLPLPFTVTVSKTLLHPGEEHCELCGTTWREGEGGLPWVFLADGRTLLPPLQWNMLTLENFSLPGTCMGLTEAAEGLLRLRCSVFFYDKSINMNLL